MVQNLTLVILACSPLNQGNMSALPIKNPKEKQPSRETEKLAWISPLLKPSSGFFPTHVSEQLRGIPSSSHGLTLKEERRRRIETVTWMFECGHQLLLPYTTIAVATAFFHRFFLNESMRVHDPREVAASCLFLAGKVEETRVRLDHIAAKCFNLDPSKRPEDEEPFEEKCVRLQTKESICVHLMNFDFVVNLPYDYLLPICAAWKAMYPSKSSLATQLKKLCNVSWKLVCESLHIPLATIVPPQHIAMACMEISLRYFSHRNPPKKEDDLIIPLRWFTVKHLSALFFPFHLFSSQLFDPTVKMEYLDAIIENILHVKSGMEGNVPSRAHLSFVLSFCDFPYLSPFIFNVEVLSSPRSESNFPILDDIHKETLDLKKKKSRKEKIKEGTLLHRWNARNAQSLSLASLRPSQFREKFPLNGKGNGKGKSENMTTTTSGPGNYSVYDAKRRRLNSYRGGGGF